MEPQHFCRVSVTWSWIFLFSFLSACTGLTAQEIKLNSTVFVAFSGEELTLEVTVHKPTNQTEDELRCYDPFHSQVGIVHTSPTQGEKPLRLLLKNVSHSGMYTCKYREAELQWFLRVTDKFHVKSSKLDYREIIIVGLFTGVLLVFSVLGSVCVFRGHWLETSSDSLVRSRKQQERREEKKETENEEDNMDMTTAQSSSFYASLEPRTRSIYDVLDHSAAKSDEQQTKTKSPETELSKEVNQNPEHQDEGIFESVYENF